MCTTVSFAFKEISSKDLNKKVQRYTDIYNEYVEKFKETDWFEWKKQKVNDKLDKIEKKYNVGNLDSYEPEDGDNRLKEEFALERATEILNISLRKLMKLIPEIKYARNFGLNQIFRLLTINFLIESIGVYQDEFKKIFRKEEEARRKQAMPVDPRNERSIRNSPYINFNT